jgi:hypothetical protein
MAWVASCCPPPPHREFWFFPLSPYLNNICPIFLLLFPPLDAALLLYVKAAIVGWLLLAVQLQKAASTEQFRLNYL